ncbi:MAG TPA: MmgE/PrpD family protein, partial [Acidimicrobiales bacterium]|nr:MmgE/PrpD family protein [Acidimicrobiales bacterium]
MTTYQVRTFRSDEHLARDDQLAFRLAELAASAPRPEDDVLDMVINRVIDNAAVAVASIARAPVVAARDMAMRHPHAPGATVVGSRSARVSPEWAAWANGVAVRELDFHDTFLAAEYAHPGDNIPAILALAQHASSRGLTGADVARAIAVAYEVQIDLCR